MGREVNDGIKAAIDRLDRARRSLAMLNLAPGAMPAARDTIQGARAELSAADSLLGDVCQDITAGQRLGLSLVE